MFFKNIPKGTEGWIIFGLIILLLAFIYQGQSTGIFNVGFKTATTTENTIGIYYKVTQVIDGDTIYLNKDGVDEKVRLIGINTPEMAYMNTSAQCFSIEASTRMKELVEDRIVRLEFDDSQSVRDTYGRLLAYIYLEDGQMVNRKMIAEGYAYEYTYMSAYKYQKEFRELQNLAKISSRGLWAKEVCDGKKEIK